MFALCQDEKVIRNHARYEALDTKKDGVRFTSRTLAKLSSEHGELKKNYQALQTDVVSEIMKVTGEAARQHSTGRGGTSVKCLIILYSV